MSIMFDDVRFTIGSYEKQQKKKEKRKCSITFSFSFEKNDMRWIFSMFVLKGQGRNIKWHKRREDSLRDEKNEQKRVTLCLSFRLVACLENLLSKESVLYDQNGSTSLDQARQVGEYRQAAHPLH